MHPDGAALPCVVCYGDQANFDVAWSVLWPGSSSYSHRVPDKPQQGADDRKPTLRRKHVQLHEDSGMGQMFEWGGGVSD